MYASITTLSKFLGTGRMRELKILRRIVETFIDSGDFSYEGGYDEVFMK
jgi:hypothetical protein